MVADVIAGSTSHQPCFFTFQQSSHRSLGNIFRSLLVFGKTFVFNGSSTIIGLRQKYILQIYICCLVVCVCPSVIGGVSNHHCCRRCCCCCCCSCCLVIISRLSWQGKSFHSPPLAYSFKLFCVSWVRVLPVCLPQKVAATRQRLAICSNCCCATHTHKKVFINIHSTQQQQFLSPLQSPKCNKLLPPLLPPLLPR